MLSKTHFTRSFYVSSRNCRRNTFLKRIQNKFFNVEDPDKRPSELEIRQKDLPSNTPTLGERIRRDRTGVLFEWDRKAGYYKGPTGTPRDYIGDPSVTQVLTEGWQSLKNEICKWKDEVTYNELSEWPHPGDRKIIFSYTHHDALERWITTADSDWGEGYSKCVIKRAPSTQKLIFEGELSCRVPRDGRTSKAGYVNMSTVDELQSFFRPKMYRWQLYTHLILKIRGDGRTYMINVHTFNKFDVHWQDLHTFPLYTRGGPYWQTVKIPFSRFVLKNRGVIQDNQESLVRRIDDVYKISISLMDRTDGPFHLEIDTIEVELDLDQINENTAYESYRFPVSNYTGS